MKTHRPTTRTLWLLFGLVLLVRLATLGAYPLTDTTEARYAEMARKMIESGNWLTPMFDVGVPFWGKPPLSFWLSAIPMAQGGVSEFTARLGPLIAGLFVMALLWAWPQGSPSKTSKIIANNRLALCGSIVFLSTPLGFIASGAVMTDMAMAAGTTLSMVAFWRAWTAPAQRRWGWLFFVGQAVGLMAKGPVAVVLTGVALTLFVLTNLRRDGLTRTVAHAWDCVPWLGGLLLTAVLVAPWYMLAEQATPGFLEYFIVGEHWSRFTQSGWKGDLYGVAHAQPKGRIWLFALLCTLPWALLALVWKLRKPPTSPLSLPGISDTERDYLLAWLLCSPLFFTMSGNILPAYVLPGLPAFSLLVAGLWQNLPDTKARTVLAGVATLLTPLVFAGLVVLKPSLFSDYAEQISLRRVAGPVAYLYDRPASAVFYGQGRTVVLKDAAEIDQAINNKKSNIAVPVRKLNELQTPLAARGWREVARSKEFAMFSVAPD